MCESIGVCVCVCTCVPSVVSDSFATPWTVSHQDPLSMDFSRPEYWSGLPFPPPGDLPDLEMEPEPLMSPELQVDFLSTAPLIRYVGVYILYM